ncbi:MAG: hypothetical protein Q9166_002691 [cf. Caloplaca sp. 2 TL-2023]
MATHNTCDFIIRAGRLETMDESRLNENCDEKDLSRNVIFQDAVDTRTSHDPSTEHGMIDANAYGAYNTDVEELGTALPAFIHQRPIQIEQEVSSNGHGMDVSSPTVNVGKDSWGLSDRSCVVVYEKEAKEEPAITRQDCPGEAVRSSDVEAGKLIAAAASSRIKVQNASKTSHDEKIMNTNNSSIVSKRSVERLYLEKPHFFRYFVKKPIRRSPLINRGYWLRMHAVEQNVSRFLKEPSEKKKTVLNLGCGYDPLPFHCLSRYPSDCKGVTFIDVDYPELMSTKRDVILETHEMKDLVGCIQSNGQEDSPTVIRSDHYVGVGCDLGDIAQLNNALGKELRLGSCLVLCIAEVSITYMDVDEADALISWIAQYNDVRFCLLEQIVPGTQDHPFARQMIQHFRNLGTPLNCVRKYPLLKDQKTRFLQAGYHSVKAQTLWEFWQDSSVVTPELRLRLNQIEPFDEWEEFALFSSHYFVLEAKKSFDTVPSSSSIGGFAPEMPPSEDQSNVQIPAAVPATEGIVLDVLPSEVRKRRKFGAIIPFSGHTVGFHGGIDNKGRSNTTDKYRLSGLETKSKRDSDPPLDIQARVCHTVTALDNYRCLLVGGRTSPDNAVRGCWLCSGGQWKTVDHLPIPLYRHCATAVAYGTEDAGVLVFGGRTIEGAVVNRWFLWYETTGWAEVLALPQGLSPRFGAAIASTRVFCGLLIGGMTEDGVLSDEVWEWTIAYGHGREPTLQLKLQKGFRIASRMGSCLTWSPAGLLLIGGISNYLLPSEEEILRLSKERYGDDQGSNVLAPSSINTNLSERRPLLIGHAVYAAGNTLLIVGGGAVCFSFGQSNSRISQQCRRGILTRIGAHWNTNTWTINFSIKGRHESPAQRYIPEMTGPPNEYAALASHTRSPEPVFRGVGTESMAEEVRRINIESAEDFDQLMNEGRPFVMEGLDLGTCTKQWTVQELLKKIDPLRLVTVHQARGIHMNFQMKDFEYVKKPFGEFIKEAYEGSPQYLRSLNTGKPAEEPARFHDDFPSLQDQFRIPGQLDTVIRNQHSSPLRISGPVNMWLHYDVMANVLCQIVGTKIVALYPPADAVHFRIPPGRSSSPINVFHPDKRGYIGYPRHHIRATLESGEVLYIPPLWLHSVSPLDNLSVSINVFFRNLKNGYATGRDVYGNRDLQMYENGRKAIEKLVKSAENLPGDIGNAYLVRLKTELMEKVKGYQRSRPGEPSRITKTSDPIIFIDNATFYRQHPTAKLPEDVRANLPIFPNITFELPSSSPKKQHWSVVGPSSAGKTTFFEILRGQHLCSPPTARSFPYLSSAEIGRKDHRLRNPSRAIQYVGFSGKYGGGLRGGSTSGAYLSARYESRREATDFTVLDYLKGNIELNPTAQSLDGSRDYDGLQKVISDLNLEDLVDMPVGNLSNGQTRRAKIAKALLDKPEVLLLDEPFMGLDPPTLKTLSPLLFDLAEAQAPRILLSLRPQDPLPDWTTHIVYLGSELQVARQGPKAEVFRRLGIETTAKRGVQSLAGHSFLYMTSQAGGRLSREGLRLRGESPRLLGEPLVEMRDVCVKYGDKTVLGNWQETINGEQGQGLRWTVRRGERWGIFGPNGSGKTTLLSLICSDHPQSYSLLIRLFSLPRLPQPGTPGISIFDLQSRIGHSSPEIHNFFPKHLSLRRSIESAWSDTFLSPPSLTYKRDILVDTHLKWFEPDLNPAYKPAPSNLTGKDILRHGEHALRLDATTTTDWADNIRFSELPFSAQRIALFLRALIKKPDLVVLDEAFSGMDAALRDKCLLFLTWGTTKIYSKKASHRKGVPWTISVVKTPGEVLEVEGVRVEGLSEQQALICVSHVKEEVPGLVRDWICLPEAGTREKARFGRFKGPLEGVKGGWEEIWNSAD